MSGKKTVPAALVVVPPTKGQKMALAHNRMAVVDRLMALSDDGEKFAVALMRVITDTDNDKIRLAAIELGLKFMIGNPLNTTLQVDMSAPSEPTSQGVKGLTTEQLAKLATMKVSPPPEDAETVGPIADTEPPSEPTDP